jgi:hypothetical protein
MGSGNIGVTRSYPIFIILFFNGNDIIVFSYHSYYLFEKKKITTGLRFKIVVNSGLKLRS